VCYYNDTQSQIRIGDAAAPVGELRMTGHTITRRSIFAQAWPIMLGQTTVPLVGLVDTAVIGHTGDAAALAGVALGSTIIDFIFWTFGFLRMGMTGMTAQAEGSGDGAEVEAMLLRGLLLGFGLGIALLALQIVLVPLAFMLLAGSHTLDAAASGYVSARFFGAPASLSVFAINGWLLGLGRTRAALALQVVVNVVNVALDLLFVWHFGLAARGVGLGTACADWTALVTGVLIACRYAGGLGVLRRLRSRALFAGDAIKRLFAVNADIMVRTLALLLLFGWFTNAGARLGATTLAANQVLMQFVSVSAFVLDGRDAPRDPADSRILRRIGIGLRSDFLDRGRIRHRAAHQQRRCARDCRCLAAVRRDRARDRRAGLAAGRRVHRRDAGPRAAQCRDPRHCRLYRDRSRAAAARRLGNLARAGAELPVPRADARRASAGAVALGGCRS
jgi:MATE family multidrug resistance protein